MNKSSLSPYAQIFINSAKKNNFIVKILALPALIQLQKNKKKFSLYYCRVPINNSVAADISSNKNLSSKLLLKNKLPALPQVVINDLEEIKKTNISFPVAVKPKTGIGGKGVTAKVNNVDELKKAFLIAKEKHSQVIIEKHQKGIDYRILVIDSKAVACCKRLPPKIVGNGIDNITKLISTENDYRKKINKKKGLKILEDIKIDSELKKVLKKNKFNLNSILTKNKELFLRENANLSTGGTAHALLLSQLHNSFIETSVKAVKTIGLKVAGVDIIAQDINKPCSKPNAAINEVNYFPGIRIHHYPSYGRAKDVATIIIKYLYKNF